MRLPCAATHASLGTDHAPPPLTPPHPRPTAAAGAPPAPRTFPLLPGVPLALASAAERLRGAPLLSRDARGWVRVQGLGESSLGRGAAVQGSVDGGGGGVGRERLPAGLFSVKRLLDSVSLPAGSPEAHAPPAIRTIPKHFQLQVRAWGSAA